MTVMNSDQATPVMRGLNDHTMRSCSASAPRPRRREVVGSGAAAVIVYCSTGAPVRRTMSSMTARASASRPVRAR